MQSVRGRGRDAGDGAQISRLPEIKLCGNDEDLSNFQPHCGTEVTFLNNSKKVTGYVSSDLIAGLVDTDTDSMRIELMEYDKQDDHSQQLGPRVHRLWSC